MALSFGNSHSVRVKQDPHSTSAGDPPQFPETSAQGDPAGSRVFHVLSQSLARLHWLSSWHVLDREAPGRPLCSCFHRDPEPSSSSSLSITLAFFLSLRISCLLPPQNLCTCQSCCTEHFLPNSLSSFRYQFRSHVYRKSLSDRYLLNTLISTRHLITVCTWEYLIRFLIPL